MNEKAKVERKRRGGSERKREAGERKRREKEEGVSVKKKERGQGRFLEARRFRQVTTRPSLSSK